MPKVQENPKRGFPNLLQQNGDNRTRTCDPLHVKQMLSQLSYVSITIYFIIIFEIVNKKMKFSNYFKN